MGIPGVNSLDGISLLSDTIQGLVATEQQLVVIDDDTRIGA